MAQYPVNYEDLVDAVNYLLSGPSGTGQNFDGFSTYAPGYIRPGEDAPYMLPYSTTLDVNWYLNIPINNIVFVPPLSGNPEQITVTFTTPLANVPFQFGDKISLAGVTPADFNYDYVVYSCTTTNVVLARADATTFNPSWTYVSGGSLIRNQADIAQNTDCVALSTVTGGTDRVFISAQIQFSYTYSATLSSEFDILVQINRYRGFVKNTAASVYAKNYNPNDNIEFRFDGVVSQQVFNKSVSSSGSDSEAVVFTQIFDGPNLPPDYYKYVLDITFVTKPTISVEFGAGTGGLISEQFIQSGLIAPALYGVPTTFTSISPSTVTGTGSGAIVDVAIDTVAVYDTYANNFNSTVTVTTAGSGYSVGDELLILGTSLGGATPANDLSLTITQIQYAGDATPGTFLTRLRSLAAQVVKQ